MKPCGCDVTWLYLQFAKSKVKPETRNIWFAYPTYGGKLLTLLIRNQRVTMNRIHQDYDNSTFYMYQTPTHHVTAWEVSERFFRTQSDGIAVLLLVFVKTLLQQAGEEHLGTLEKQLDSLEDDVAWPKDAKANRSCV